MGRIYLARNTAAGPAHGPAALVAIKVIRPEYAEDQAFRRRFEREVQAVRRVHSTHTAELVGSGFDGEERLWMATAYVPGLSLGDAVRRCGPFPAPAVWRLACEIGRALVAIDTAGIVHRDLKPSNVLLGADGTRVIDFGVARTADTSSLTMTGQQLGTPAFMSPEQANGREVTVASDVFSLGSVLALALTGTAPFGEGTTGDVLHRVIHAPPSEAVSGKAAASDPGLAELIGRCLAKDPEQRPTPQQIVEASRNRTFEPKWPDPVAELIETRADWSGPTVSASLVDQLTVLRRPGVKGPAPQKARRSRRRTGVAVGALVVVIGTASAFALPQHHAAQAGGRTGPQPAPTVPPTATSSPVTESPTPTGPPLTSAPASTTKGDTGGGPSAVGPAATVTTTATATTVASPASATTPAQARTGTIVNAGNHMCAEDVPAVVGGQPANHDYVELYGCTGSLRQRWTLQPNGSITLSMAGGTGAQGSGMCIGVGGDHVSQDSRVML